MPDQLCPLLDSVYPDVAYAFYSLHEPYSYTQSVIKKKSAIDDPHVMFPLSSNATTDFAHTSKSMASQFNSAKHIIVNTVGHH